MDKLLIHNSYINDKSCTSTYNTRKNNISYIFDTTPTFATKYDGKNMFKMKKIDTTNTSDIEPNVKKQ